MFQDNVQPTTYRLRRNEKVIAAMAATRKYVESVKRRTKTTSKRKVK